MPFPMTFIDHVTAIPADWLNFVNDFIQNTPGSGAPLPVVNGGTGVGTSTGTGSVVLSDSPSLSTPSLTNPVIAGGTADGFAIGYKVVPQNTQSASYTLVTADSGKHLYHPVTDVTARTWTIPANTSVSYPIGTELTFINDNGAGAITIAIAGTDTLRLAGSGATGTRTLAANGMATAIKMTSTSWMINGTGLT